MSALLDRSVDRFVGIWNEFQIECDSPAVNEPEVISRPLADPTKTLESIWLDGAYGDDSVSTPRSERILSTVRSWLQAPEQTALFDRSQVESLFNRCAANQSEAKAWRVLPPIEQEAVFDGLLRIISGISSTIRQERPRSAGNSEFHIR